MNDEERWREIARRYRESTGKRAIEQAAAELEVFLKSPEGAAALDLLGASGHIELARKEDGSSATIWLLSWQGLQVIRGSGGAPTYSDVTPKEAVEVVFSKKRRSVVFPSVFMLWLRHSLNEKAAEVERALAGGVEG